MTQVHPIAQKLTAERTVRSVKEGTTVGLVQSGLPMDWRDGAMECCCFLRDVQDQMAHGQAAFAKCFGKVFAAPIIHSILSTC